MNDKTTEAQAKAKIDEVRARLAKGEKFEALAKEFSQDPGSANNGGDPVMPVPGVYDPAFEKALYSLSKDRCPSRFVPTSVIT